MNTLGRPLIIGHRGASGYRPEHTRAAYELAFTLGADAVEPDIVATRDGVLVVRHENEMSGTTDVAEHPQFADRRTTKLIDGVVRTGWFTEDFTAAELGVLRARERLPSIRRHSASFDGRYPILRLAELIEIIGFSDDQGHPRIMVAELKHASYFASIGLPLDELFAAEVAGWARADNLITESFEQTVLGQLRVRGVPGRSVFLAKESGAPADLVAQSGAAARSYAEHLSPAGLGRLSTEVDGVGVAKTLLLEMDATGNVTGTTELVTRAHDIGLQIYTWTLRAENRFLAKNFWQGSSAAAYGCWREEFALIMGTGVDGVFTDQPDLALAAL
ncbi:MAG: glycerophosphodiester phosphodiesterase family protein [Rhodoglobus sp.]